MSAEEFVEVTLTLDKEGYEALHKVALEYLGEHTTEEGSPEYREVKHLREAIAAQTDYGKKFK